MTPNIYSYLRHALHTAISKAFPEVLIRPESIPLFFKSPLPTADLNTPIALRIASMINVPAEKVALHIMSCFEWDNRIIDPDPLLQQTVVTGFISFRVSLSFQYEILHNASQNTSYGNDVYSNKGELIYTDELLQKITPLLKHAEILFPAKSTFETAQLCLLCTAEEHRLMRLIAISQADEVYSSGAAHFFIQQLVQTLICYFGAVSVFTSDDNLTIARITLMRASYNRVVSLRCLALE